MTTPPILLVAHTNAGSALRRIWDRVAERWPDGEAPGAEAVTPQSLLEREPLEPAACLILRSEKDENTVFHKLIDRLEELLIPTVVLFEAAPSGSNGSGSRSTRFAGMGAIAAPADIDPQALAGMTMALLRRQETVESLSREVRTANRFHGGLRDEITKMHEELQLATAVQRDLLPPELPKLEGLEFAVLFRPCGYVGGDIYNVARLDERRIGFFVADAVGHGVPAALMTVVLSRGLTMVDTSITGRPRIASPADAMERLNEALLRGPTPGKRFATAVYGVIDTKTRRVKLAGAGHPPPLHIRADGAVRPIETDGALLGVFADGEFDEVEFTLADGDMLVVYSDGFETAFSSSDPTGRGRKLPNMRHIEHFGELVEARRSEGLAGAMAALTRRIDEHAGSLHQADDLTALVIGAGSPGGTEEGAEAPSIGAAGV